ncbi:MAG: S-layer homology domain-containing protein, partial [Nitrospirota bacterium]
MRDLVKVLTVVAIILFVYGCAKKEVARCVTPEDNPPHHYLMGMGALEKGQLDIANAKFDRAVYCDEKFSLAYCGLAIVTAEKTKDQTDAGFRKVET